MAPRPRASERSGARESHGLTRARWTTVAALALAMSALGACRQMVVLDTAEELDGGGGFAGSGPFIDSGAGGEKNGNGGMTGGNHFDAGHLDGILLCQFQNVPFTMRSPDVIVSVDRSSDMQSWFGTGTRLEVIQQQVQALVSKYRAVKFGYQEFPSPMGMCSNGQGCCAGEVGALPSYNNLKAIRQVMNACDNGGANCNQPQRPIADALSKCYDTFKNVVPPDDTGHRYVLLFTSGDPTCAGADPMTTPCGEAVARVTKLANTFTNTVVFGVGDAAAASACVGMLAMYGQIDGHNVKTPNDLSSALGNVVDTIAAEACKIDVRSQTDPDKVQLLFDGIPEPRDGVDGWTFDPGTNLTLTVNGSYCRTLVQSTAHVDLVMGCLPPTPPHN